jgi:plastocyanin
MQSKTQATTRTILTTKPRTLAWFCTLAVAILFLLAACGESTTGNNPAPTATSAPSPTATSAPSPTATSAGNTMEVTITTDSSGKFAFSPTSLTVAVGTTVTWRNSTGAPHTVTSDDGSTFNGMVSTGGMFSFTFTKAGTFPYHCNIHPYMMATIVVH